MPQPAVCSPDVFLGENGKSLREDVNIHTFFVNNHNFFVNVTSFIVHIKNVNDHLNVHNHSLFIECFCAM